MANRPIHTCQCSPCTSGIDHSDRPHHGLINLLVSHVDEQTRRWVVALESKRLGYGGDRLMAEITGLDVRTIRRGRHELDARLEGRPSDGVRLPGGGRPRIENTDPAIESTLSQLLAPETAGDPMGPAKWSRLTLRRISTLLSEAGHIASRDTVSRLLKAKGYSLKVNAKRKEAKCSHPDRDQQFQHIAAQKHDFQTTGDPVISVDTKKKS